MVRGIICSFTTTCLEIEEWLSSSILRPGHCHGKQLRMEEGIIIYRLMISVEAGKKKWVEP